MIENENPKKREGKISIKNKTTIFTKGNICTIILVIILVVLSSLITTEYVLRKINVIKNNAVQSVESDSITDNIIKTVGPSLVTISSSPNDLEKTGIYNGNTTGVIINNDGLIITNYDAIKAMKHVYVKLPAKGAKPEEATFLGDDSVTGIALLKINNRNLTPVQIADTLSAKVGNTVLAIGNASNNSYVGTVIPGIVTSTSYFLENNNQRYSLIQTSAVMNSQNYGGVLCNQEGQLIGLNSEYMSNKFKESRLDFAVGVDAIKQSVSEILSRSDKLGIKGAELSDNQGFYISSVKPGSLAEKAKLKATDIIVSINGQNMNTLSKFYKVISGVKKGETLKLEVLSGGNKKEIDITL